VHTNELLQKSVGSAPNGYIICDAGGSIVYANESSRRLLGLRPDAPLRTVLELFSHDPDARARLEKIQFAAHLAGEWREDVQVPTGAGTVRWISMAARHIELTPGFISWLMRDVTLEREMEQAVRAEQARLAEFIDQAPVGFYSVDNEGRFLFVNQRLADWLDVGLSELIGGAVRLDDVLSPEGDANFGIEEPDFEASLRAPGGATRPVRITQSTVMGPDGELRSRSVVRDLTQERKMRQALTQAELHFQSFFDRAPIGICTLDASGGVLDANERFEHLTGGGKGSNLPQLVRAEERPQLLERLEQALGNADSKALMEVHFDGPQERIAQLYADRLGGSGSDPILLICLVDTTGEKKLEMQFAQSQKLQAVGQLAGGVAHDFNNLLTAMIGFCDLLLLRHQPGDQSFADVMQIKQNANRAANLVRQLLAFSRQQTLRPKVLNLTDVLADLRNLLSRLIGENIELKMVHARGLGVVQADQGQFEQVIINLAVNARDAMANGGTLTIRTANVSYNESQHLGHDLMPPGEYVLVEVGDTGGGIAEEFHGKVFEPFFTTKEIGQGTGLGLSTVYGIVKQTGGFVFLLSAPGQGAVFQIYLPRHQAVAQKPGGLAEAPGREPTKDLPIQDLTGKGVVLLVEDEDAVRTFAARALRNKGYTVLEANSGERALELAGDGGKKIDLLVSDVVMPVVDGPTLARLIRVSRPNLKIIFISGYAEDAFRRYPDTPVDINFLAKPFSLSQLAGKVKDVLAAPR
jgi:two-component system cell cycle sensor histidine kinase/response regulator CckA